MPPIIFSMFAYFLNLLLSDLHPDPLATSFGISRTPTLSGTSLTTSLAPSPPLKLHSVCYYYVKIHLKKYRDMISNSIPRFTINSLFLDKFFELPTYSIMSSVMIYLFISNFYAFYFAMV